MKQELQQKLFETMLQGALREHTESAEEELLTEAELRARGDTPHVFSPAFERRMKPLLRRQRMLAWRTQHSRALWRAATVAALFVVISGLTIAKVDALRIPIMGFFMELGDNFSMIKPGAVSERSPLSEEMIAYLPTYVPEGFVVSNVQENPRWFHVEYQNEEGQFYYVDFLLDLSNAAIDTENSVVTRRDIAGSEGVIVRKDDRIQIVWVSNGHMYDVTGYLSQDEAIRILESVKK